MEEEKRQVWLGRAKRLRQIRELLHLSRRAFCERLGFSPNTVTYWETVGAESPGIEPRAARRIAYGLEALGCSVSPLWLLEGTCAPPALLDYDKPTP